LTFVDIFATRNLSALGIPESGIAIGALTLIIAWIISASSHFRTRVIHTLVVIDASFRTKSVTIITRIAAA
jgi:hypothetical protein